MGLYLCVFDDGTELDGIDVGSYADFGVLRDSVSQLLENGRTGSRFPVFGLHSDCDGEWSAADCEKLRSELDTISHELAQFPPVELTSWQKDVADSLGIKPATLAECYMNVDGEPLLTRLRSLCDRALESGNPILFQ